MAAPVPFTGTNLRLGAPAGRDDVEPVINAFTNGACVVTCWQLHDDELAEIARTGKVYLSLLCGNAVPPAFIGSASNVRDVVSGYGKTIPQQQE